MFEIMTHSIGCSQETNQTQTIDDFAHTFAVLPKKINRSDC